MSIGSMLSKLQLIGIIIHNLCVPLNRDLWMADQVHFLCRSSFHQLFQRQVRHMVKSIIQRCSDPHSIVYLNLPGLLQFNPQRVSFAPAPIPPYCPQTSISQ